MRKAGDAPHYCPVCGRLYVPNKESVELPGTGPLMWENGELCIKAGDGWSRAYYHGEANA